MTAPTPGTWSYVHENGESPRIVSDAIDPGTGKPCVIVDLRCAMRCVGDDIEGETHANALLFAASKDMLRTIKYASWAFADVAADLASNSPERTALDMFDGCIAKAEGRT